MKNKLGTIIAGGAAGLIGIMTLGLLTFKKQKKKENKIERTYLELKTNVNKTFNKFKINKNNKKNKKNKKKK